MAKAKKGKQTARRWSNLLVGAETHVQIDRLCGLLAEEDPIGQRPSKHRAVQIAVAEAIRAREIRKGGKD